MIRIEVPETYLGFNISEGSWRALASWNNDPTDKTGFDASLYNEFGWNMRPHKVALASSKKEEDSELGDFHGRSPIVNLPGTDDTSDEDLIRRGLELSRGHRFRLYDEKSHTGTDTWFKIHEAIEEDKLTLEQEYSYKLAMGKSSNVFETNIVISEDGSISHLIEDRFKASKRLKGTADSKHKSRRFKCPDCGHEEVGYIDIRNIANELDIPGWNEYDEATLRSIPEVHEVFMNRMLARDFDGYIDSYNLVTADEYGHCPYCGERIYPNKNKNGGTKKNIHYNLKIGVPYKYVQQPITGKLVTEYIEGSNMELDEEGHQDFYAQFEMKKKNFDGKVHKKSSGRDPTGHLAWESEEMTKWLHDTPIQLNQNVSYDRTGIFVKVNGQEKEVYKGKATGACPECGCNYKVKDLMRGETVCPECGEVFGRAVPDGV